MPSNKTSPVVKSSINKKYSPPGTNGNKDVSGTNGNGPSHEQIAELARQIYQQSGCVEGNDAQNWLQAEHIMRDRANRQSVSPSSRLVGKPEARTDRNTSQYS
jgi:hypothetical protein